MRYRLRVVPVKINQNFWADWLRAICCQLLQHRGSGSARVCGAV